MRNFDDNESNKENRKTKISNLFKQFKSKFTSEEDCVEEIYKYLIPEDGFNCNHCSSNRITKEYGARHAKCKSCSRNSWITADSFFCRTRRLLPWLLFIWMLDHGITLNSMELSDLSGLATSSSQHIIKKVSFVLKEMMKRETRSRAHSSKFIHVITKRSRETPAREHPRAEIKGLHQKKKIASSFKCKCTTSISINTQSKNPQKEQHSTSTANNQSELESKDIENEILETLSQKPAHIDSICQRIGLSISDLISSLTIMEVAGKIKNTGRDYYQLSENHRIAHKRQNSPISKFSLKKTRLFIKSVFQGVSRKYLQLYLATFWYKTKMKILNSQKNLLELCVNHGDISHRTIYSYVSPQFLTTLEVPQNSIPIRKMPDPYFQS